MIDMLAISSLISSLVSHVFYDKLLLQPILIVSKTGQLVATLSCVLRPFNIEGCRMCNTCLLVEHLQGDAGRQGSRNGLKQH